MIIKYGLRAIILGILIALCSLHYDRWIADRIGPWVQASFERMGSCTMHVGHTSCTFLSPSVTFHDVIVKSSSDCAWHWSAKQYTIAFSWLNLVFYGMIDMHITIEGLQAHSDMQGSIPAIFEHIQGLMGGQSYLIPTFITAFTLNEAQLTINDNNSHLQAYLAWNSTLNYVGNDVQARMHIHDGHATYNATQLLHQLHGSCQLCMPMTGTLQDIAVTGECTAQFPLLPYPVQVIGSWQHAQGTLTMHTEDQNTCIEITDIHHSNDEWNAHTHAHIAQPDIQALANIPAVICKDGITCDAQLRTHHDHVQLSGTLTSDYYGALYGTLDWDSRQHKGTTFCTTESCYTIPLVGTWCIQPHACNLTTTFDSTTLDVQIACTATHTSTGEQHTVLGKGMLQQGTFTVSLSHSKGTLECAGTYLPTPCITRLIMHDSHQKPVIRALTRHNHTDSVHAIIDVPFARTVAKKLWGYDIQGEGTLALDLKVGQQSTMRLVLSESTIRLPGTYNFIRNATALCMYDNQQKLFTIKQGVYQLDHGIVRTDGAQIIFGPDGHIESLYIPLLAQQCMVTFDRGVFALLSGYMHVRKDDQPVHIGGHILIDQAHLEGNIFSHMFQRSFATSARDFLLREYTDACMCDVTCESVHPISIKTAFLETKAHTKLAITGPLSSPAITGNVTLVGGTFLFPYKPLYITRGAIYFDAQQPQDSLVEVTASNKIKKYTITMHISGSLSNNSIHLTSSPPLSEEQILSLLLIGSQEESLNMVMPALIMQNLTSLVFNQMQTPTELEHFFARLLKPFEYIRFVPSFADQSGRGGLRGTLEIEITDRLRAMIQKNFSLLEDTRFEIEYVVSDDITVRGMRNERRDVGGEIEVRWKF